MRCGNCHESHDTVDEVRKCYGGKITADMMTKGKDGKRGQYELIQDLLEERGMTPLPPYEEAARQYSKQAASDLIAHLINNVPRAENSKAYGDLPDVAAGYYAVKSLTGNNDLDFFEVDRPTEGRWAGSTFVKRVIGGRPSANVRGRTAREALQAIIDAGPGNAALLYGQELEQCSKCNRHLTKKASRTLALGPDCADQRGLGAEWARLDAEFGGE